MNYFRRIEKPINELKYKMQIGALLLNIKSLDNKINTIEKDMSTLIRRNIILDKTYTIQNFSDNRGNNTEIFKINLNSQFSNDGILKINANYKYIGNNNFSHVYKFYANNNKFKEIILDHKDTIISDEFEIKTIESSQIQIKIYLVNNDGDNRLIKLYGNNNIQIKYLDNINNSKINMNINKIDKNEKKIDNFTQHILKSGKDFEKIYNIEKQIFRFNRDKHFYKIFEKEIEYNFTINSLLFVKNNMFYKYDNLSNDYHRLQHEYNIYDGDNLIHRYLFNKDTYYEENSNILHSNEDFCICFKKNYKKIRINLLLHRHNRHGIGNINCELDYNENYIKIDYVSRDNISSIKENKKNIASNLINMNINEDNIAINTSEIEYLKKSKIYLKNLYNEIFHNEKTQILFSNDKFFYEKVFEDNYNINDFIEISLDFIVEIDNISNLSYVKIRYNIYDDNDNRLYIKTTDLHNYKRFFK